MDRRDKKRGRRTQFTGDAGPIESEETNGEIFQKRVK